MMSGKTAGMLGERAKLGIEGEEAGSTSPASVACIMLDGKGDPQPSRSGLDSTMSIRGMMRAEVGSGGSGASRA